MRGPRRELRPPRGEPPRAGPRKPQGRQEARSSFSGHGISVRAPASSAMSTPAARSRSPCRAGNSRRRARMRPSTTRARWIRSSAGRARGRGAGGRPRPERRAAPRDTRNPSSRAPPKRRAGGNRDRPALAPGSAAAPGREELVAQDVDHRTGHDLAVDCGRDTHREERNAVNEVDRPVERIDHPLRRRQAPSYRPLLRGSRPPASLEQDPLMRSSARRSVCVTTSVGDDLRPTGRGRP